MTKDEIKAALDAKDIQYDDDAKKPELEELLASVEEQLAEPTEAQPVTEEDEKIAALEAKIARLEAAADKGRLYHYDNQQAQVGKKAKKVNIAVHNGKYLVGWRTLKDTIVKHPTTGVPVGEAQEYEILLDNNGEIEKETVEGYPRFTDIRYAERVECPVVNESTDYQGNVTYEVQLPEGRTIKLASQFIN